MKRFLALILVLISLSGTVYAETVDLSGMTLEELVQLQKDVEAAIALKATPAPQPTRAPIKQGAEGTAVLEMKLRLYELGYFTTDNLSDVYNGTTVERVKLFQKINGLPQTGTADSATLELLFSNKAQETDLYKPTPKPTPKPTATPKPYAEYQKFDYKAYSRYPDLYYNQKFKLTGKIVQVLGSRSEGYQIRLATKNGYDDVVYVFIKKDPGYALLEDDKVTIYAKANKTVTYQSIFGQSITIPAFNSDAIELRN